MPHVASLTARLAALRVAFTGERPRAATAAVRQFVKTATEHDREMLADVITVPAMKLSAASSGTEPMPDRLRGFIPAAAGPQQLELEAGVFDAACEASNQLHDRPPVSTYRPAVVVTAAHPRHDRLVLRVDPIAVGPLLTELLPYPRSDSRVPAHDTEVGGVPGLRVYRRRRRVELALVDAPGCALVELAAVSDRAWQAALAYLDLRAELMYRCGRLYPRSLSPQERWHLGTYGRVRGPIALSSALLRRIGIFEQPKWLHSHTKRRQGLVVQWPPGVSIEKVASGLLHPLAGLAGAYVSQVFGSQINLGVPHENSAASTNGEHLEPPKLHLRADDPPSAEDSPLQQLWRTSSPFPEWVAWEAIYNRGTVWK